jgi:hypothetical protein
VGIVGAHVIPRAYAHGIPQVVGPVMSYLVACWLSLVTLRPGRLLGRQLGPFMKIRWLVLINRSSRDSATAGLGNRPFVLAT